MSYDASVLFQPYQLGDIELKNRLVLAPLTRNRATHGTDAPNDLNVEYYRQRASGGLLITEATQISQQGQGYAWTPGIYTDEQVAGWSKVTKAVHEAGGRIFIQLWHVGRISHTSLQPNGAAPVAPSAIRAKTKTFIETGFVDVSEPRALTLEEIPGIVEDYVKAAQNAKRAGFDGVEIHAANGYLLDQFLKSGTNTRTDAYGGSVENRARLTLEVAKALLAVWKPQEIGIRISPVSPANDAVDADPQATFGYLVKKLDELRLGYLHVVEGVTGGPRDNVALDYAALKASFRGAYMANNGYTRDMAIEALASHHADLIAIGRPWIANPDLVERFKANAPLNELDQDTLYGGGAKGYTDYPTLKA